LGRQPPRLGRLRAIFFALLGRSPNLPTYNHQRVLDDRSATTGDGHARQRYAVPTDGHLVRLRIGGDVVRAICAASA